MCKALHALKHKQTMQNKPSGKPLGDIIYLLNWIKSELTLIPRESDQIGWAAVKPVKPTHEAALCWLHRSDQIRGFLTWAEDTDNKLKAAWDPAKLAKLDVSVKKVQRSSHRALILWYLLHKGGRTSLLLLLLHASTGTHVPCLSSTCRHVDAF